MSNASISFIMMLVGAALFAAGFITTPALIGAGAVLVALATIYPFVRQPYI